MDIAETSESDGKTARTRPIQSWPSCAHYALIEILVHPETREILHVGFDDPYAAREMLKRIEER